MNKSPQRVQIVIGTSEDLQPFGSAQDKLQALPLVVTPKTLTHKKTPTN